LPVIAGGDGITVTFPYTQPLQTASLLQIQLAPNPDAGDYDESDNIAPVVTDPLFDTIPTVDTPLGPRVGANFEQQGAIQGDYAVIATLHLTQM